MTDLVSTAGSLVALGAALGFTWRRRASWEPSEEDLPRGAQKVGGLLTAIAIGLILFWLSDVAHLRLVSIIAIGAGIACLVFFLGYGLLISVYTYEVEKAISETDTVKCKIIGGFSLTPNARQMIAKRNLTIQELLKGAAYDPDKVWPRGMRGLAKLCYNVFYIGLTASGTIAITCISIVIQSKIS